MPSSTIDPIRAVLNQSTPLENHDSFQSDAALKEAVVREGAGWAVDYLSEAGKTFSRASSLRLAALANEHPPELRTHDRQGRRLDQVDFHPAWHELLEMAIAHGIVSMPYTAKSCGHVARAALHYLYSQTEVGTECPIAMSYGAIPVLEKFADQVPQIREVWLPKLQSAQYDARFVPAPEKAGVLFGMGMTERQGGSDVRSNITQAKPQGTRGIGLPYLLRGHKWFFSAPMCDAFLVTAQAPGGISCFLVPRFLPDGTLNAIHLQRLKEKLGNHSNASSEVEFHDAIGYLLGEEGQGVATIIEMATYTRLDCVLATSGMQRRALSVAIHHASQREAFGARLIDKPLMSAVLADLAIESEAATSLAMYLAKTFEADTPEIDRIIGRILTPAAKFHVCKRGPQFAAEAIEVLGGNGYVEELDLARIYRELPLLSVWEGSGNVMVLDVIRSLAREPKTLEALHTKLTAIKGDDERFDRFVRQTMALLNKPSEARGREIAHRIVLAIQGAHLIANAPDYVANAFCATRLAGDTAWGASFGTLPNDADVAAILNRAGLCEIT